MVARGPTQAKIRPEWGHRLLRRNSSTELVKRAKVEYSYLSVCGEGKMIRVKLLGCFLIGVSCAVSAVGLDDDMHGHHHEATEKLGKVSFPISCAAGSQAEFERG